MFKAERNETSETEVWPVTIAGSWYSADGLSPANGDGIVSAVSVEIGVVETGVVACGRVHIPRGNVAVQVDKRRVAGRWWGVGQSRLLGQRGHLGHHLGEVECPACTPVSCVNGRHQQHIPNWEL